MDYFVVEFQIPCLFKREKMIDMKNRKRIGIVTVFGNINFGSNLQSYALQTILRRLGYHPENLPLFHTPERNKLYQKFRFYVKYILFEMLFPFLNDARKRSHLFEKYIIKNIRTSKYNISKIEDLEKIGKSPYNYYICGSDQIWAPNQFNPHFFLSFCNIKRKKIAYAPSVGLKAIPENLIDTYDELISDIGSLSIREADGAKLLKDITGINIPVVLDPTLLLNRKEWLNHAGKFVTSEKYILCYFLTQNNEYFMEVENYARLYKLKVYVLPSNRYDYKWGDKVLYNIGPKEFIQILNKAEVMITDSFHGTIFSVNLHKNFYTFLRFGENDPLNQNSRVINILNELGLNDHLINPKSQLKNKPLYTKVDWELTENELDKRRMYSLNYLKQSLYNNA